MLDISPSLALLALAMFLGFSVQTALGFGAGLISLSLAALWMPIQEVVPFIAVLSVLQSTAVLVGEREHVAWRPLLRTLAPMMALGIAAGLWLATVLVEHDALLRRAYGGLVIALALPGLWPPSSAHDAAPIPTRGGRTRAIVASSIAGVVHGLFATGGPPLAYAAHCLGLQRDAFRTTLITLFIGANVIMVVIFVGQGRLRAEHAPPLLGLLGAAVIAIPVGRWLARCLPEASFRRAVYGMLLITGLSLLR